MANVQCLSRLEGVGARCVFSAASRVTIPCASRIGESNDDRTASHRRLIGARTLAALAVTSLLVACGSSAIPAGKLTNTQASIRAAEARQADTPNSALYLKMARDGLTEAKRLVSRNGDNEEGRARARQGSGRRRTLAFVRA